MKKLLMIFMSLVFLTACSSDDDSNSNGDDPIIGTWILVGSSITNPQACTQESTITFNQDNSGSGTFYIAETECQPQNSSGNWQNLGNSRYSIVAPVVGTIEGVANFTGNDEFTFTTALGNLTFERQ